MVAFRSSIRHRCVTPRSDPITPFIRLCCVCACVVWCPPCGALVFCQTCSEAEGELSLSAGDYILVWNDGEPQGGYFDAELLDGRRGLVPATFVQRLLGAY